MSRRDQVLIELSQVSRVFRKGPDLIRAVDAVNLTIRHGDLLALVGPSGSGKSTLLHLIGGLDTPTEGAIHFDGHELTSLDDRTLSRFRNTHVGFVFQNYNLLAGLTVEENVALPLRYAGLSSTESRQRARTALKQLGLEHRLHHYPSELSGGEEQRAAIARAIVTQPQILLADEPTGNLDSANRDRLLALLREQHAQGLTVLIVTHDPAVAAIAQTVLKMQDGRLA